MGFFGKLASIGALGAGALIPGIGPVASAALIGGGLNIGKRELVDIPKEQEDLRYAATTQRLSPWTGLQAKMPERGNYISSALKGGFSGLGAYQTLAGLGSLAGAGAAPGAGLQMPELGAGLRMPAAAPGLGLNTAFESGLPTLYGPAGGGYAQLARTRFMGGGG